MKILLLGEYSNVHNTLAQGLRELGHTVPVVSNGDFWKNYPRDIDVSRRPGKMGGMLLMAKIYALLPRLRGYDIVQFINPMFFELKAKDGTELVRSYEKAVQKATKYMEEKGYFRDECIGDFWKILETRPYMRLRAGFAENLVKCGKMGQAREECRELLKLCDGDNLGMRYHLMHIYTYFEEEEAALALHKHFDLCNETQMLFPLSILYYKKGNYTKATQYLRKLNSVNKDLKKFLQIFTGDLFELFEEYESENGYRPNTIEELIVELNENLFLFTATNYYSEWALKQVKKFK